MRVKVLLVVMLTMMTLGQLMAVPARRQPIAFTQPDGTTVTVYLCGDEYQHFYTTTDGVPVTRSEDGYFYYTQLDAENNPVASSYKVIEAEPLHIDNGAVLQRYSELNAEKRQLRNSSVAVRRAPMSKRQSSVASEGGAVRGLIILVNFQDKTFITPQTKIDDMMNKEGYTDNFGSIGSARDYFKAQSYGSFVPDFDVVGPVTLSRNMSYYGGNDRYGSDQYPDVMVSEACEIASEQGLVNMADYDLDDDGWVDLVYVIYAGYAESSGAPESTIWPHAWYIYQGAGRTVEVDGVYLDAYACSSELASKSGSQVDGIGTFCHEYSHTLGLPDFYDIDYSGGVGMNTWSIMDAGCYAVDGYVPTSFSAYERFYCGWIELNELTTASTIEMVDLNIDKTAAYRISSDNDNQFLTIETRTRNGWDKGLPAQGMMVTAIDYDAKVWDDNAPNDVPSRQRVKLIPADNRWDSNSMHGDLYPYNGNTELTSSSTPSMTIYNNTIVDKPITNIVYSQGVTTFDFMGGGSNVAIDVPVATAAGDVTANSFTAYWSPVDAAVSYDLYVERVEGEPQNPEIAFEENFDGFNASSSMDIANKLDQYTTLPGWSGSKVFCYDGMVKLGSSSAGGSLTTPSFSVAEEHTIYFDVAAYDDAALDGVLTMTIEYDGAVGYCDINLSELSSDYLVTVAIQSRNKAENCYITFDCDKRIFLDNLKVKNSIDAAEVSRRAVISIDALTYSIVSPESASVVSRSKVVSESYTFENITSTHYNVTKVINNVCEGVYRYKVRAVTEQGRGGWSNVIEVEVPGYDAIADVMDTTARIYATDGVICVESSTPQVAAIYTLQGLHMATIQVENNDKAVYAPAIPGIYLVRCGNHVAKVIVR